MKAMVLRAPSELRLGDVDPPEPEAGEAVVRATHGGICGTDVKIYNGDIPVRHPLIMGHEAVGELVEGAVGQGLAAGSRVIVDPGYFCGRCFHCRRGQTNICPSGGLIGRDRDGGFAEFLAAPLGNIFALPDEIRDHEAPLLQVLSTCLHAQRLAPVSPDEPIVVVGLGVTGQLHVQLAKARGANPVIGVTRSRWKRALAERLGADLTLAPGDDLAEDVLAATEGRGADLVIETVGQIATLAAAIEMARVGGRVLAFGIQTAGAGELPFYQLYFKELQIVNARASKGEDFTAAIELVQRGLVRLEPLVSHVLPLEDLADGLGNLTAADAKSMKIIIEQA